MSLSDEEKKKRIVIVGDSGGVLPQNEAFYIHSVIYCASRAQEAFVRYDVCLACQSADATVVSTIHEALSHTASLSRFFWPSRDSKLHKMRSQKLRGAFQMSDNSTLKDRCLRNALEHFDERLDLYLLEYGAGCFFPSAIIGNHELADEPTARIFKLVDPEKSVFVILNEKFSFLEIRKEVERIQKLAECFIQNGSRIPQ